MDIRILYIRKKNLFILLNDGHLSFSVKNILTRTRDFGTDRICANASDKRSCGFSQQSYMSKFWLELCMRAAKALASLCICANLPEPLLFSESAMNTGI